MNIAAVFVFLLPGLIFLAERKAVTVLSGTIADGLTGAEINGASVILYGPSSYIATADANGGTRSWEQQRCSPKRTDTTQFEQRQTSPRHSR